MNKKDQIVYCDRKECFAAMPSAKTRGVFWCDCLINNDFGDKECPFFKTEERRNKEIIESMDRHRSSLGKHIRTISGVEFTH